MFSDSSKSPDFSSTSSSTFGTSLPTDSVTATTGRRSGILSASKAAANTDSLTKMAFTGGPTLTGHFPKSSSSAVLGDFHNANNVSNVTASKSYPFTSFGTFGGTAIQSSNKSSNLIFSNAITRGPLMASGNNRTTTLQPDFYSTTTAAGTNTSSAPNLQINNSKDTVQLFFPQKSLFNKNIATTLLPSIDRPASSESSSVASLFQYSPASHSRETESTLFNIKHGSDFDSTTTYSAAPPTSGIFTTFDTKAEIGDGKKKVHSDSFLSSTDITAVPTLFGKPIKAAIPDVSKKEDWKQLEKRKLIRKDKKSVDQKSRGRGLFIRAIAEATGSSVQQNTPAEKKTHHHTKKDSSAEGNKPSTTLRRTSQSRLPSDDFTNKVALVCKNVPGRFNTSVFLRKHFSRFGEVSRMFTYPAKGTATVHFKQHEAAAEAKLKGHFLAPGILIQIFWRSYSPPKKVLAPSLPSSTKSLKEEEEKTTTMPSLLKHPFTKKSPWMENDELADELQSMVGTTDITDEHVKKLDRPDDQLIPQLLADIPKRAAASVKSEISTRPRAAEKKTLSSLKMMVAVTAAERVQLLELRDKLLRQGSKRQASLTTAQVFIGTCEDMCPEKERYDREEKRRLSICEILPGTVNLPYPKVDHARAIKEYSRSSADKEEPLLHELRPSHVLMRTMTYLLKEVVDTGCGQWSEWYDFLWNRTRGIRKDITQQQICNMDAVELTEKCSRFHIFCSEWLCEEDAATFDEKINNENLTKCLQSLKELYMDLDKKMQLTCPNEAEFRAYMVLMNLNEGDILREVQQLRPEVRNSAPIHFALRVYSALNNNNYIRFFRLVRQASFLNGCIMHRYFTQIRSKALMTIMKAFCFVGRPIKYHLLELVRTLAFESIEEASNFCKHYGFVVENEEIILDRTAFIEPEMAPGPRKAGTVIEYKCTSSIGEVINGGPHLHLELPVPYSSFDEQGKYKGFGEDLSSLADSAEVEEPRQKKLAEETKQKRATEEMGNEKKQIQPTLFKHLFPNDIIKGFARELFLEVIREFCQDISVAVVEETNHLMAAANACTEDIVQLVTTYFLRNLCLEAHSEVLREEKARKEQEKREEQKKKEEEKCERVVVNVFNAFTEQIIHLTLREIAVAEMGIVEEQLREKRIERCSIVLLAGLLGPVIGEMAEAVAQEVYQNDVLHRLKLLEECGMCITLYRKACILQKWKSALANRIQLKQNMLMFPCSPALDPLPGQLKRVCGQQHHGIQDKAIVLNKRARLSIESPLVLSEQNKRFARNLNIYKLYHCVKQLTTWHALDMRSVLGPHFVIRPRPINSTKSFCWKLLISIPELDMEDPYNMGSLELCDWIKAKLTKGEKPKSCINKVELLSLYKVYLEQESVNGSHLRLCIKSVTGSLADDEITQIENTKELQGTSGLLFILPVQSPDDSNYWLQAQLRLATLLQAKPIEPRLPLAIITPQQPHSYISLKELKDAINLEKFIDQQLLSAVQLFSLDLLAERTFPEVSIESPVSEQQLCRALQWLASHIPPQPELEKLLVQDYIEGFLAKEFYTPILYDLKVRKSGGFLHQFPDQIIGLYNSVICHLAATATNKHLKQYSWPITEFAESSARDRDIPPLYWNDESHLQNISKQLLALELPHFVFADVESEDWYQVVQDVWNYVSLVTKGYSSKPANDLVSRIKKIILDEEKAFERACSLEEDDCVPTYVNMPWTDIILPCVNHRLISACWLGGPIQGEEKELEIVYEKSTLDQFVPPEDWQRAVTDKNMQESTTYQSTIHRAVTKKRQIEKQPATVSVPTVSASRSFLDSDAGVVSETWGKLKSLRASLHEEKNRCINFDQFLQTSLHEDDFQTFTLDDPDISMQQNAKLQTLSTQLSIPETLDQLQDEIESDQQANGLLQLFVESFWNQ